MTVTVSEAPASVALSNKSLISDQLWRRITNRIVKDEEVELQLTERIMDQALGFLRLCAMEPNGNYSPSKLVDIGWHTFILYTRPYADFCEKLAGKFIHHNPSDEEGIDYGKGNIARTVAALKQRGMTVDEMLWLGNKVVSADCSSYCSGDSCSGGGGDGDSGCSH